MSAMPKSRLLTIIVALFAMLTLFATVLSSTAKAATQNHATVTAQAATTAPAATRTWKSGAMAGYGGSGAAAFATWRGAAVQTGTDYLPQDTWAGLENPAWDIWAWGLSPQTQPVLSAAMFPKSGGSLAESASGADNAHWVTLAKNLVAGGLGSSVIRLGWEFNGTWYPWSVTSSTTAAQYAAGWRQIVTAMRSVPGAHFSFDWCMTVAPSGINPVLAYPGNAYVDYIGEDAYDWNERGTAETSTQRWNDIVSNGYGLDFQASLGKMFNKALSFPEWGVANKSWDVNAGGNDDPSFVQNMFNWFGSHDTSYEDYFNADSGYGLDYGLTTGNGLFPKSAALYQSLYSKATYTATAR
jgi:hypothetical protein